MNGTLLRWGKGTAVRISCRLQASGTKVLPDVMVTSVFAVLTALPLQTGETPQETRNLSEYVTISFPHTQVLTITTVNILHVFCIQMIM